MTVLEGTRKYENSPCQMTAAGTECWTLQMSKANSRIQESRAFVFQCSSIFNSSMQSESYILGLRI